jgi:hypothetical protein
VAVEKEQVTRQVCKGRAQERMVMRSVGATLTLLILVVPILFLSSILVVLIYAFRISLDAPTIFDLFATSVSMVLVNLLVWERLRDSLSRRLGYLHDIVLSRLHQQFRQGTLTISATVVERAQHDLTQHGRFMGLIKLYPDALLAEMEEFSRMHRQFFAAFKAIEEELKTLLRKTSINRNLVQELLGLKQKQLSAYSQNSVWKYREACETLTKKHPIVIKEMASSLGLMREKRKLILEKLEAFMKTNSLRLERAAQ